MDTQYPYQFEIFAAFETELHETMAAASARLAKAGLPAIQYDVVDDGVVDPAGRKKLSVTLASVLPHYDGYALVSRLEFFDGEALIKSVPGRETPEQFRIADSQRCDHCGIRHSRVQAYVIEGPDGFVQVGSSCLRRYLPSSALALVDADWVIDLVNEMADDYNDDAMYRSAGRKAYDLPYVVKLALRIIANSGWVSATVAKERGTHSTADLVRDVFAKTGRDLAEWKAENPNLSKYDADAVITYCQTMPGTSDYAYNIRTLAKMTHIPWTMVGFVASMPSAYIRHIEAEAEKKVAVRNPAPTGRVNVTGTVVSFKDYETDFGMTTKVLIDCDGGWRLFATLPQSLYSLEIGDRCSMTVTVKPDENDPSFARGSRPTKGQIIGGKNE